MIALFLGSHCDDIELGCGATIHKHQADWQIVCLVLSHRGPRGKHPSIWKCSRSALSSLGAGSVWFAKLATGNFQRKRQALWEYLHEANMLHRPDLVFTQEADEHQDHATLYQETLRVFRSGTILSYRSTVHSCPSFAANVFEPVSSESAQAKLKALGSFPMYEEKPYFCPEHVLARLRVEGIHTRSEYAEAFRLVRLSDLGGILALSTKQHDPEEGQLSFSATENLGVRARRRGTALRNGSSAAVPNTGTNGAH